MKLEKYENIIQSPLKELGLSQLYKHIQKENTKIQVDDAYNIFVKNTDRKNDILVVAHLDRVLDKEPHLFRYESTPKRLYGAYGWDDRAGIIAALELFYSHDIDLLFTTGEESGCTGAKCIQESSIKQYKLIFELDRHGNSDFINDCSMGLLCNEEFTNEICKRVNDMGLKLKPQKGVYTDIGALRYINNTAQMFYMSCGYYNEHTTGEYLIPEELEEAITKARIIIDYVTENPDILKPFVPEKKEEKPEEEEEKGGKEGFYCYNCDCYLYEDELLLHYRCPFCGEQVEKI